MILIQLILLIWIIKKIDISEITLKDRNPDKYNNIVDIEHYDSLTEEDGLYFNFAFFCNRYSSYCLTARPPEIPNLSNNSLFAW